MHVYLLDWQFIEKELPTNFSRKLWIWPFGFYNKSCLSDMYVVVTIVTNNHFLKLFTFETKPKSCWRYTRMEVQIAKSIKTDAKNIGSLPSSQRSTVHTYEMIQRFLIIFRLYILDHIYVLLMLLILCQWK